MPEIYYKNKIFPVQFPVFYLDFFANLQSSSVIFLPYLKNMYKIGKQINSNKIFVVWTYRVHWPEILHKITIIPVKLHVFRCFMSFSVKRFSVKKHFQQLGRQQYSIKKFFPVKFPVFYFFCKFFLQICSHFLKFESK